MNAERNRQENVIRAERIDLVDREGNVRAVLGLQENKEPGLFFQDQNGRRCLGIGVGPDGKPGMLMSGANGGPNIFLGIQPEGAAKLVIRDGANEARIGLGLMPDKTASLVFFDADQIRAAIVLDHAERHLGLILRSYESGEESEGKEKKRSREAKTRGQARKAPAEEVRKKMRAS